MTNPFDYVKSIMTTKERMEDLSGYNPWLTNVTLSNHVDTILQSNLMNQYFELTNEIQYEYYYNIVKKKRRPFKKFAKPEIDNDIELIQRTYNCNRQVAMEYRKILNETQMENIRDLYIEGG